MTLQVNLVNLGEYPNDGSGDDLRSAFEKTNANFQNIKDAVILNAANLGNGTPLFLDKSGDTLRFRTIATANNNMSISYDSNSVTLNVQDSINSLEEDTNPILGGNLNLNNRNIQGFGNININGNITANTITGSFNGNFSGNITGNITGNLLGNVTGQVSDISNHDLSDLRNVSSTAPAVGQALVWNGISWAPGTVASTSGVTRIIAGNNITISPNEGTGEVTINSTSTGSSITNYDFGLLSGVRDPFDLIMQFTNVDFGTISNQSSVSLDLGPINTGAELYDLESSSAIVTTGNTFIISLTTINVENGTVLPYTITGVSSEDIDGESLVGSFTVNNGFASKTFTSSMLSAGPLTFVLTLNGIFPAISVSVTLSSTSSGLSDAIIDGGSPGSLITVIADGEGPGSLTTVIADGGIVT